MSPLKKARSRSPGGPLPHALRGVSKEGMLQAELERSRRQLEDEQGKVS